MAVLTISREFRSGGREVGAAVAEKLAYQYVGKERILEEMGKVGDRWRKMVFELDEAAPTLWERYDMQYRGFIALIESAVYEYALKDRTVIIGRGGNFLLEGIPHVLRVRLTAPLETRIGRVIAKDGVDRKTAERLIQRIDRARAGYIRAHFGKEWHDVEHYDVVFNTEKQPFEEIADLLVEMLEKCDRSATVEGMNLLSGRALAAQIKAAICTNPKVVIPTLNVFFDGREVVLRGIVHKENQYRLVEGIVRDLDGNLPVRNEIRLHRGA
ncbi:MAG TPA: cytidylate kinase family protein [Syntrophales bacterium]|nr:cytidylate kinase family protein [Syntrophales bacterium]